MMISMRVIVIGYVIFLKSMMDGHVNIINMVNLLYFAHINTFLCK